MEFSGAKIDLNNEGVFEVTTFIGRGAFGLVYNAINKETGKIVAIKFLPVSNDSDSQIIALLNEAELAPSITHPNVIKVLKVNVDTNSPLGPYIVMEYASGGTLSKIISEHKSAQSEISLSHATEMMLNIAQGAKAINKVLIHRDIKPDNILLDDKHLKISDFGISKVIDEQTRQHTFKGRQHVWYMAPEAWTLKDNTLKLDVYSVGLVFYEILTLMHPLKHFISDTNDFEQWRQAHLYELCEDVRNSRTDVSLAMAQLLQRMVAKKAEERPDWDEIIKILEGSDGLHFASIDTSKAVEAAIKMSQQIESMNLQAQQIEKAKANHTKAAALARRQLLQRLDTVIDDFNKKSQGQSIKTEKSANPSLDGRKYFLPGNIVYECSFGSPFQKPIKIPTTEFEVMAVGYLGPHSKLGRGKSGNLLWVRRSSGDIYGEWKILLVRKLMDTRGRYKKYIDEPFGLDTDSEVIDQLSHYGALHTLSFELRDEIELFFTEFLQSAFTLSVQSLA